MFDLSTSALFKTTSYISGKWQTCKHTFSVVNPATSDVIAEVSDHDEKAATLAIQSAKQALKMWSAKTAEQRSQLLKKWLTLILSNQDELACILTLEQGKPLPEAQGEIAYGASFIEWFAEEGKRVYGETIPAPSANQRIMVIKQPVGVVAAITPWNFPNAMIVRKAAAALAAGCTFIVKPSEQTPLSALALAELADQAGIPAGVFNVVVGTNADAIGKVLTRHSDVDKFTFTGSTKVGKKLTSQCSETMKKVSMELGGNAPFIVFNDADIDAAVDGVIKSKFRNGGQTCISANRFFVHTDIHETFLHKLKHQVQQLTIGNGMEAGVNIGPLISDKAVAKVQTLVTDAVNKGARLVLGEELRRDKNNFYSPCILTNVEESMDISQEEIFGPVVTIRQFKTEQEVIKRANNTEYGLAAYFYSRDVGRIWRVSEQLQVGMLGINEGSISNAAAPFGGIKQSGIGREGSKYGLEDYLELKYLCFGGIESTEPT